jgi:hypothetical protein
MKTPSFPNLKKKKKKKEKTQSSSFSLFRTDIVISKIELLKPLLFPKTEYQKKLGIWH